MLIQIARVEHYRELSDGYLSSEPQILEVDTTEVTIRERISIRYRRAVDCYDEMLNVPPDPNDEVSAELQRMVTFRYCNPGAPCRDGFVIHPDYVTVYRYRNISIDQSQCYTTRSSHLLN